MEKNSCFSYLKLNGEVLSRPIGFIQPKDEDDVEAGVRPQSKVASDCTLAPDPRPAGSTLGAEQGSAGSASGGEEVAV